MDKYIDMCIDMCRYVAKNGIPDDVPALQAVATPSASPIATRESDSSGRATAAKDPRIDAFKARMEETQAHVLEAAVSRGEGWIAWETQDGVSVCRHVYRHVCGHVYRHVWVSLDWCHAELLGHGGG